MKFKKIICLALALLLCLSFGGCSGKKRFQASFLEAFDTVTVIVGYAKNEKLFTEQAEFVRERIFYYNNLFDIYNNYEGVNNIKTINDNAGKTAVAVDEEIIKLLLMAKDMYTLTEGKLNVAMGAVLRVWHDYREAGTLDPSSALVPPMELLKEKALHTDIDKLVINEAEKTVFLTDPEMSLDVGAIAKGYATSRVAQECIEKGYTNLAISVGGNVYTIGTHDDGTLWKVAVQNPLADSDTQDGNILDLYVSDTSVVTSGSYQRYYTVNNVRYHHIIDPQTLMPKNDCLSVTIICPDSALADALSTALFNMSPQEGLAYANSLDGVEAMYILPDMTFLKTQGFDSYTEQK